MLEGKAVIKETDMQEKMRNQAMASASQALDLYDVSDCISIAAHIKKEFDKKHGGGWQCVVGSNFGCFITHTEGSFVYFALGTLNFLIFKGASLHYEDKQEPEKRPKGNQPYQKQPYWSVGDQGSSRNR